jgi:hypothetical protein
MSEIKYFTNLSGVFFIKLTMSPWGMTRYGRRKQHECRNVPHAIPAAPPSQVSHRGKYQYGEKR